MEMPECVRWRRTKSRSLGLAGEINRSLPNRSPPGGGQSWRPEGKAVRRDLVDAWEQGRRRWCLEGRQKSKMPLLKVKAMLSSTAASGTCRNDTTLDIEH